MADFAAGTWNLDSTEGFDDYMKAVGVGMVMRKMGATAKPTQYIKVEGDTWDIKTATTLKTTQLNFKLGEEFDEATADGRNVKSSVGMVMRKMGATAKPTQYIKVEGDTWDIKTATTLKTTQLNFKLGEEFDEATADGRNVKTTFVLDGKKLTATQKGDIESTISREWDGDTMTMLLEAKGAVCKRIYKRAQ